MKTEKKIEDRKKDNYCDIRLCVRVYIYVMERKKLKLKLS